MSVTDLIPVQYRVLSALIALAVAMAAAAAAAVVVEHWRMDGDMQRAIATEKASYAVLLAQHNALTISTTKQNGAVDLLAVKADAADQRRALAEKYAAGIIQTKNQRIAEILAGKATTCEGVLRESWGKR
jgi:opacity protein-like surface antigen